MTELSAVGRVGTVTDEALTAVLADSVYALWVGAVERLGPAARLHATHLLFTGQSRQVLDVAGIDAYAPDTADKELIIAGPQVPRQASSCVHCSDEEERA